MALTVRPATTRAALRDFHQVAHTLHQGDPIWTPPLRPDLERSLSQDNPLWQAGRGERTLLVAYDGDVPVGRVLAHAHLASNARHRESVGLFGLLECPDDLAVARALLDEAAAVHRLAGRQTLRGPYELTVTQCIGMVVSGFDEPASFSQSWNAPHLPGLVEQLGFHRTYLASTHRLDDVDAVDPDALLGDKQRAWLADPQVRVRSFDMGHFERDMKAATTLLNTAFSGNFGFVPLTQAELDFMAGPMKRVVRPELTVFLEHDGEPVGVALALPDFHVLFRRMGGELFPLGWAHFLAGSRTLDAAVVQFLATDPRLQNQGLMRVLVAELLRRLKAAGFRTLDGTWIGDVNPKSLAQVKAAGLREKHRLAVYERPL
jgi:GNAT superfamily N-acetyltransferase